jgi:hypothetical protein
VALVGQWRELESGLPAGWGEVRVRLHLEETARIDRAAALLGPLQAFRASPETLTFRVSRAASPGPDLVVRLLERLDGERLHGTLELVSLQEAAAREAEAPQLPLAAAWDLQLATLPADWSDLLAEVELTSSDYIERAALHLAPLNPRRDGDRLAFRLRCAQSFGYGASPGMVRRCLERCDAERIRGTVLVLRVLSDTRPVQTQGPVWQLSGRTV